MAMEKRLEDQTNEIYEKVVKTKEGKQFKTLSQTEQAEEAKGGAKVAYWGWIGKRGVPFVGWTVAGGVAMIFLSLLVVGIAYVCHILGWGTLHRVKEVKSLLGNVFTFLGGATSTSLLFYLNRKPRQ